MNTLKIYAFADEASPKLQGQIAAMKRNRLDGIEIRNVDGVNVSNLSVHQAKEILKQLEDQNLCVWSLGSPIGKIDIASDDFEKHLDVFRHTLEIGEILKAKNMRIFSFYIPELQRPEDYRNEVIERLGRLCDLAEDSKICLCHENEKGIYGDIAKRCLDIYTSEVRVKGVFDPANFVQSGQDVLKAWELLHPYIKYLHIKDACLDGKIVPAGQGAGHLQTILSAYRRQGGCAVTMEPHLAVFQGLAALEREGEKSNVGEYGYPDNDTAFDIACSALRNILD